MKNTNKIDKKKRKNKTWVKMISLKKYNNNITNN